ncbi:MAG: hypothetical protein A3F35_03560 [Candidatus Woykebacteria bacterium RIFCSPHIGHO2_12_FULL_45_10]|uniref:Uncharacterized protein n=1 Tax=Candidatus Woykebacteria bacterium RIFCSPHIGHO2_12_FULL_45_10 TaxID=1802603 RepID=A0A1G1WRT8_9BACT|nr:MAG: hypothetical protein A3F35_03560 [Candidatus Woykebacteria bacterium RIFCSPHIGHO2_12_FULL_45_10]
MNGIIKFTKRGQPIKTEGAIKLNPLSPLNAALASFIMLVLLIDAVLVVADVSEREEWIPTALRDYVSEQLPMLIIIVFIGMLGLVGAASLGNVNQLVELALFCLIGALVIWQNWPLFEAISRVVRRVE